MGNSSKSGLGRIHELNKTAFLNAEEHTLATKKRRPIKRVYEKGRETTVPSSFKKTSSNKKASSNKKEKYPRGKAYASMPKQAHRNMDLAPNRFRKGVFLPKLKEWDVRKDVQIEEYEALPSSYGITSLTLLPKDPFWIYAYWNIDENAWLSITNKLPEEDIRNSRLILRIYDVTFLDFNGFNANSFFDIEVGHETTNWYISLWHDNLSYIGEVGIRTHDGKFHPFTRSNCVQTPRIGYAPRSEQIWMTVTDTKHTRPYIRQKPKMVEQVATAKAAAKTAAVGASYKKTRRIYLTEEDIRRYYSSLSPLLRDIVSSRLSKVYEKKARSYQFAIEGETDQERQTILSRSPENYFIKRIILGASQDLVLLGASGASESLQSGASDLVWAKMEQRKFFFELNTELIVYGRTEPDAEVRLGNKNIPLRKDGTFSLRFALPDGTLPLGFTAVSKDKKEKRQISTTVVRSTKHGE